MNNSESTVDIENPSRTYVPSGKWSDTTVRTYALFVPLIALLIQIPLGVSHGVVGFCLRFASGLYVVVAPLLFGAIAFAITGAILAYGVSVATRNANCRNERRQRTALWATIALSLVFRVLVTSIVMQLIPLPHASDARTPLDLPGIYWIETLLSFGVVSVSATKFLPKMTPYCETCNRYMARQRRLFVGSDLPRIVSELSRGVPDASAWTTTKAAYPSSAEVELYQCNQCHNGFVKVDSFTTVMKDGKEQRSIATVFADQCQPRTSESLSSALRKA